MGGGPDSRCVGRVYGADGDVHLVVIFVYNQPETQFFFMYVYFYSLHVLDSYVSIIRRILYQYIWYMSLC